MRASIHFLNRPLAIVVNILIAGAMLISMPALANDQCVRGTLEAEADLLTPFGPVVGSAVAMIGGQVLSIQSFGVIVSFKVTDEGTIHLEVEENDSTPDGSTVQIMDKIKLTPTAIPGEFTMTIKSTVISGTGLFADASGKYKGEGHASFNTLHLSHSGEVRFCGLAGF